MLPAEHPLAAWAAIPFASQQEVSDAMTSDQYKNPANEAYRQAVYAKMALSDSGSIGVQGVARRNSIQVTVRTGPDEAAEHAAADAKALAAEPTHVVAEREAQAREARYHAEKAADRERLAGFHPNG